MAEFNQLPQPDQPGSYTGLSEGIRSSPNTALGDLFSGLAQTLDQGIKETDRNIKANIESDIFDAKDSVDAEFGIPEATDLQSDPGTMPAGVKRAGAQLDTLHAAFAKGLVKESHYWARMNNVVRMLRGKYPGYRGEIDQMVSGITGAKPANALRSALFQEWQEEAKKANGGEKDNISKLEDWAVKQGDLPQDYFDRKGGANPYSEQELQAHISRRTFARQQISDNKAQMEMQNSTGELDKKTVERNFKLEANSVVTTMLMDLSGSVGADWRQLQQKRDEAVRRGKEGNPLPQAEVDKLRYQYQQIRGQVEGALRQAAVNSWNGKDPKMSTLAFLDKKTIDDTIASALAPLDLVGESLTNQHYGILGASAAAVEASKIDSQREVLKNVPIAASLKAIGDLLGPSVLDQYLLLNTKANNAFVAAMSNYQHLQAVDSINNGSSVDQAFAEGEKAGMDKEYYTGLTERWANLINTTEAMDPKILQNNVNFMFGEQSLGVMARLDDKSKFEYFRKVSSPVVTKKLLELKNAGDIDSWNKYQSWVSTNFQGVFKLQVQNLQNQVTSPYMDVKWDPVQTRFVVTALAPTTTRYGPIVGKIVGDVPADASKSFAELNGALQIIKPILDENGADTGQEIAVLLSKMGYDPKAAKGDIITKLLDAVQGVKAQQEAEKAKGVKQQTPNMSNLG